MSNNPTISVVPSSRPTTSESPTAAFCDETKAIDVCVAHEQSGRIWEYLPVKNFSLEYLGYLDESGTASIVKFAYEGLVIKEQGTNADAIAALASDWKRTGTNNLADGLQKCREQLKDRANPVIVVFTAGNPTVCDLDFPGSLQDCTEQLADEIASDGINIVPVVIYPRIPELGPYPEQVEALARCGSSDCDVEDFKGLEVDKTGDNTLVMRRLVAATACSDTGSPTGSTSPPTSQPTPATTLEPTENPSTGSPTPPLTTATTPECTTGFFLPCDEYPETTSFPTSAEPDDGPTEVPTSAPTTITIEGTFPPTSGTTEDRCKNNPEFPCYLLPLNKKYFLFECQKERVLANCPLYCNEDCRDPDITFPPTDQTTEYPTWLPTHSPTDSPTDGPTTQEPTTSPPTTSEPTPGPTPTPDKCIITPGQCDDLVGLSADKLEVKCKRARSKKKCPGYCLEECRTPYPSECVITPGQCEDLVGLSAKKLKKKCKRARTKKKCAGYCLEDCRAPDPDKCLITPGHCDDLIGLSAEKLKKKCKREKFKKKCAGYCREDCETPKDTPSPTPAPTTPEPTEEPTWSPTPPDTLEPTFFPTTKTFGPTWYPTTFTTGSPTDLEERENRSCVEGQKNAYREVGGSILPTPEGTKCCVSPRTEKEALFVAESDPCPCSLFDLQCADLGFRMDLDPSFEWGVSDPADGYTYYIQPQPRAPSVCPSADPNDPRYWEGSIMRLSQPRPFGKKKFRRVVYNSGIFAGFSGPEPFKKALFAGGDLCSTITGAKRSASFEILGTNNLREHRSAIVVEPPVGFCEYEMKFFCYDPDYAPSP